MDRELEVECGGGGEHLLPHLLFLCQLVGRGRRALISVVLGGYEPA